MKPELNLGFNLSFPDLYTSSGLKNIDNSFNTFLFDANADLWQRFQTARKEGKTESNLLMEIAPYIEDFIGHLFDIKENIHHLQEQHHDLAVIFTAKRQFVQRYAIKKVRPADVPENITHLLENLMGLWDQKTYAVKVLEWLENEEANQEPLKIAATYAVWAIANHSKEVIFHIPHKLDFANLLGLERQNDCFQYTPDKHRHRDGFSLTDEGFTREQALDQANYCIWCHHQGKDSCSKGLKTKGESTDRFQKNPLDVTLAGCPLEEKISEMQELKTQGYTVAALAMITLDNPMVAATGHRICNDCMKACIYQKQEPVNTPGIETQVLTDVLNLPWGFEIYSLLTRWNPLNMMRPYPFENTNKKVLVVGMGPAGFTLAHHLMNDGHDVMGIDGLKIEPLNQPFQPIYDIKSIQDDLQTRLNSGFGGVAEYGITVRWNKNYLKIIRLLLERRSQFSVVGGVRFGGTLTIDQAFEMGFDHIALCMGAGQPTLIPMENGLAHGVRQASDFLMALQLTGAAKKDSLANLQVRLPVVVIGGGLTAIDTATEALAYYPLQVEKFWQRSQKVNSQWNEVEKPIAEEFLRHGQAIAQERALAEQEGREPRFIEMVQKWGGVTLAYRRDLTQAPSYTLNHEEVAKALEEGIVILDHATPKGIVVDEHGHAAALTLAHHDKMITKPARTILIAAGTKPNTNLRYDDPEHITLDGKTFQAVDEVGNPVTPERLSKPLTPQVLMKVRDDGKGISFFGDLHPSFAGNVVKAMASAKQGYSTVTNLLKRVSPSALMPNKEDFEATIVAVNRLTPTIVEIVIKAPLAAKAFKPGQFYRLQNFETYAPIKENTRFAMEGLALTGAKADPEKGLLSTIVLEMGGSSSLCKLLKPGEPVILMGPTGTPTEIPTGETVLLAGGGLGNAVLFSIGQEMRQKGNRLIYFAGYKALQDRYKIEEIEAAADEVIWCCDEAPGFMATRPQDRSFVGNIVAAMADYAKDASAVCADRLIAIGSDRMMAAVALARHTVLKPLLKPGHVAIGSINSPMQCMMKEICAQCLQRHVDPVTGVETIVYSCANQDQSLDLVDFANLQARLGQNSVQEKMTKAWIEWCG